jgi:hypothetical protein
MTLLERGGVAIVRGLLGSALEAQLLAEANERLWKAEWFVSHGRNLEWRGGEPARKYRATAAGSGQYAVFSSKAMTEAISEACGFAVKSSGTGSYTYYHDAGDYLGLHRDIELCEVATITCLEDDGPGLRGGLRAYPEYAGRPLIAIYEDRPQGLDLTTFPGDTIVIAGGFIPHEVTPIVHGQRRTVALACFAMV